MTIPSLPTALNTNDVVDNAWVDGVRAGLELHRDTGPLFRHSEEVTLSNATSTEAQFSDGVGGWRVGSPAINVGGFTAGSGGAFGVIVPEDGYYDITLQGLFTYQSGGGRSQSLYINGTLAPSCQASVASAPSPLPTRVSCSNLFLLNAGDEVNLEAYQNSGSTLANSIFHLTIEWRRAG